MLQPLPKINRNQRYRSGQTNLISRLTMGAPTRGITSQKSIAEMDPEDAVRLRNLIVKPYGLELRRGYQLHQNTLGARVNTLIPHQARDPVDDRLFATTFEGVFDVTGRTDNAVQPALDVTFATQTALVTDTWSWVPFSNLGENFTCMVSEFNGYYTYDRTNGWVLQNANLTGPAGFDPLQLDYVTTWKRRLWFVPQSSTKVYYLPVNQITGVVQEFDFGPYMRQGGEIKMLASWTRDGGDGMDDFLVVIGSQGDIVVYQGTDPANSDTFSMVGIWDVGVIPFGRRAAIKSGGDIQIICETGLIPLSELFQGAMNLASKQALGYPIQTIVAQQISASLEDSQWELHYFPREELTLIKEPIGIKFPDPKIWAANLHSRGWSQVVDYPMQTLGTFQSELYGADDAGNVYQLFTGDVDNLDFQSNFNDITGVVQTGFSKYEASMLKKFQIAQITFQSPVAPAVQLQMKTEFDFDLIPGSAAIQAPTDAGVWDDGLWDDAVWGGAANTFQAWVGLNGVGYFGALMMNVRGPGGAIFTHWTLTYEQGGTL